MPLRPGGDAADRGASRGGALRKSSDERRTVAVLGASRDRRKYGNKSVRAHDAAGYDVFPVNPHAESIEGLRAYASLREISGPLDRVSVYLPPEVVLGLLPEIAASGAREVFLNPGSESDEVVRAARALGVEPILACSIVDVGFSPAQFP
jgi:predicted CoA-binding protein